MDILYIANSFAIKLNHEYFDIRNKLYQLYKLFELYTIIFISFHLF